MYQLKNIIINFLLLLLFLCFVDFIYAEQKHPRISVDFAQFRSDSTRIKLEIYQSVSRNNLVYSPHKAVFVANFQLETKIFQNDSLILEGSMTETDTIADQKAINSGQQFVYTIPFSMKPGRYEIVSLLKDLNNSFETQAKNSVDIKLIPSNSLLLSDIQFAMSIKPANEVPTPFDKNNLRIIPNPQALYGDGLEQISFYAELYNMELSNKDGQYHVDYLIEDRDGNLLYRIPGKTRSKKKSSSAIYTSFDISSLFSGKYILHLKAMDDDNNNIAAAKKSFTVFRQKDAIAENDKREKLLYNSLDEEALRKYFDQISYLAENQEKKIFKELNLGGKREFIFQFWKRRDPTPGTPENEFKDDYVLRLLKAKVNFTVGSTEGWKTDRGRILLKYGIPDFMDRNEGLSDRNAYEVWNYETLQSGALFVFIEIRSDGIYQLIHSTYRDEISNPDWQSYLYK